MITYGIYIWLYIIKLSQKPELKMIQLENLWYIQLIKPDIKNI